MRSNPVVPMHQVMTDVAVRFLSCHVAHGRYPFSFQAAKHTLHRRVIPAVSTTAHALAHAVTPESLAKLATAILRALIRAKQKPLRLATLLVSHVQRLDDQIRIRLVRQRPAHHSAHVKIHNHSQVMPFPLCPDVGDVATPNLIRLRHIKLSIQCSECQAAQPSLVCRHVIQVVC